MSSQTYTHSPQSEINFEEYIKNLDELVNSKVAQGFQMMISKIVVLIEEQVKFRVTDEVAEQLGKMMIKGRLINKNIQNEKAKTEDGKSNKDALLEMDSNNSELHQCVSVLDMEQSYSKIDKIDEESEDDGTYNTQGGPSEDPSLIHQSRVTLQGGDDAHENTLEQTGTSISASNIEVSIEQPMK